MAENRQNKFSYDRSYYEIMRKAPVDGSAARKLEEDYEEDIFEDPNAFTEEYTEADFASTSPRKRREEPVREVRPVRRTKVKVKTEYSFKIIPLLMLAVSLVALVGASYRYIEARAEVTQVNKKIAEAKVELQDVQNINMSLKSKLDVEVDRNYIFTIAVGKLNMVYPKDNNTIYYEKPDGGYVRQYQEIPAVK